VLFCKLLFVILSFGEGGRGGSDYLFGIFLQTFLASHITKDHNVFFENVYGWYLIYWKTN
jgi:hypothetical protein